MSMAAGISNGHGFVQAFAQLADKTDMSAVPIPDGCDVVPDSLLRTPSTEDRQGDT